MLNAARSGCILIDEMALDLKGACKAGLRLARVEYEAMREVVLGTERGNALKESIVADCGQARRPGSREECACYATS